jgi:ribosomal protein S18 acetylase RimI-like enzyme
MEAVSLRPMREGDYPAFRTAANAAYLQSLVGTGLSYEEAEARTRRTHAELLPQGFRTPGHHFRQVMREDCPVGAIWFQVQPEIGRAFLFDIVIDPEWRGQGIGRATMKLWEEEARGLGARALGLNVFRANQVAWKLYESLGYAVDSARMVKRLD